MGGEGGRRILPSWRKTCLLEQAELGGERRRQSHILLLVKSAGGQPGLCPVPQQEGWLPLGWGHPFATITKSTCNGFARGGLGCRAAAEGTGGHAGRPHMLHQPHATSKGTRHTRVASGRPVALPAPRAALSPLSPVAARAVVPPCQRIRWLRDSGAGWPGRALQLPPSPLLLRFINNAAPRHVGSAAHTPAAPAQRWVLRGRTAGTVTPSG